MLKRLIVFLVMTGGMLIQTAWAVSAANAYVTVSSSTKGVEDIVPIKTDFYLTTRGVGKPSFKADIDIKANDPYYLVKPVSKKMRLGIEEKEEYKVKDESGNEDAFKGMVHVLKLDIEPQETNVCWKSTSCTLKLTEDSFPGGTAIWTSVPEGIDGRGKSITFNPNVLTAGVYTVTARSEIVSSYKDSCIVRVVKVEFVTPDGDPVSSPNDSGDGQNEFTYSAASPGVLTINLKARVTPASAAPSMTNCQFTVDNVGTSVKRWAAGNPNGKAVPSGDHLAATVTFTGLPNSNSDFGMKKTTISWAGSVCDARNYEVFFPKEATNHPGGQADSPNWFYYWKEGGVCGIPSDTKFEEVSGRYGYWKRGVGLFLCDCAATDDSSCDVSADFCITNLVYSIKSRPAGVLCDVSTSSVGMVGMAYYVTNHVEEVKRRKQALRIGGDGKGIGCVAMTVKHELGHCEMNEIRASGQSIIDMQWNRFDEVCGEFGGDSLEAAVAYLLLLQDKFKYGDNDLGLRDGVPDGRERDGEGGCYSNDSDPDTYRLAEKISNGYALYGDEEVRMRLLEVDDLSSMYHEHKDWANPGCQSKDKYGPIKEK